MEVNKIQTVSGAPIVQGSSAANIVGQAKSVNESSCYISADEESTLVSANESSGGGVAALTHDNLENEIRNTKGTTYVVVGSTFCGRCKLFAPVLEQIKSNVGSSANFVKLTYNEDNASGIYETLAKEAGNTPGGHGLPLIIKCVDGKAVDFMDYSAFGSMYKDADSMTQFLSEKIEGTYSNPLTAVADVPAETVVSETVPPETVASETATPVVDEGAKVTDSEAKAEAAASLSLADLLKLYRPSISSHLIGGEDTSVQDIKDKIEVASSITDLKSIVSSSSSLSSELQSKLNDALSAVTEKSDLASARNNLLNLL